MPSPTQRTLKHLRECGYLAEKVEQRLPIPDKFVTRDLFNWIDIVAIDGRKILGVQATSGSNHSARRTKTQGEPSLKLWKSSGGIAILCSWAKRPKDGVRGARKVWVLKEELL